MSANVTICAPFRNSGGFVRRFAQDVFNLDYRPDHMRFICVEGDSTDDTWQELQHWRRQDERMTLLKCETHKPHYGNVVDPERFAILAAVFNTALNAVDLDWSDYVLFTPSDVTFAAGILPRLLAWDKDMIAPFFFGADGLFHDTWAFVRDGEQFGKFAQVGTAALYGDAPIAMDTVGGMVLIRTEILCCGCRYTAEEVDRGLCKAAQAQGFGVWADPSTHIVHN